MSTAVERAAEVIADYEACGYCSGECAACRGLAQALADAGIIPDGDSETRVVGYAVVHESESPLIKGEKRYGVAGSLWPDREPVENHLAYCEGMQERERPGSEGRYFIAEVREVTDDADV